VIQADNQDSDFGIQLESYGGVVAHFIVLIEHPPNTTPAFDFFNLAL